MSRGWYYGAGGVYRPPVVVRPPGPSIAAVPIAGVDREITTNPATIVLTATDITVNRRRNVAVAPATIVLTATPITVNRRRNVTLNPATLVLTTTAITVTKGRSVTTGTATLVLVTTPITVNRRRGVTTNPATLVITATTITVTRRRVVALNPATLILAATPVTVNRRRNITTVPATLTLVTTAITVTRGSTATEATDHDITWTWTEEAQVGQFVDGSWWAVGPDDGSIELLSVTRPWAISTRDGTTLNPDPTVTARGWEQRKASWEDPLYNDALNAANDLPLVIAPGTSIVSVLSATEEGGHTTGGAGTPHFVKSCSVLTVLAEVPPANAFRPGFWGTDKTIYYTTDDLRLDLLATTAAALNIVGTPPTIAAMLPNLERVWIDTVDAYTQHPWAQMPEVAGYGRDLAPAIGDAILWMCCDHDEDPEDAEQFLYHLIQKGIDYLSYFENGGDWAADGGINGGRKMPTLFAGFMLDDEQRFIDSMDGIAIHEDQQTFYIEQSHVDYTPYATNAGGYTAGMIGTPEWGVKPQSAPQINDVDWEIDTDGANYRRCCTNLGMWSSVLVARRFPGMEAAWAHSALFAYQQRYYDVESNAPWNSEWLTNSAWGLAMWLENFIVSATIFPGTIEAEDELEQVLAPNLFVAFQIKAENGVNLLQDLRILFQNGSGFAAEQTVVLVESYHEVNEIGYVLGGRLFAGTVVARFWVMPIYGHLGITAPVLNRRNLQVHIHSAAGGMSIDVDFQVGSGHTILNGQAIPPTYFDWNLATNEFIGIFEGASTAFVQNDFFLRDPGAPNQQLNGGRMSFRYRPGGPEEGTPLDQLHLYRMVGAGHNWRNPDGTLVLSNGTSPDAHWFVYVHAHVHLAYARGPRWWIVPPLNASATHGYSSPFPPWTHQTNGWGAATRMLADGDDDMRTDFGYAWINLSRAASWLSQQPDINGIHANTAATSAKTMRGAGRQIQMGCEIRQALTELRRYRSHAASLAEIDGMLAYIDARIGQLLTQQYDVWQSHPTFIVSGGIYTYDWRAYGQVDSTQADGIFRRNSISYWELGHWFNGLQIYQETRYRLGLVRDELIHSMQLFMALDIFAHIYNWALGHPYAAQWPPNAQYPTHPHDANYHQQRGIRWAIPYSEINPVDHPNDRWMITANTGHTTFVIPAMEWLVLHGGLTGADATKLAEILEDYEDVGYWWRLGIALVPGAIEEIEDQIGDVEFSLGTVQTIEIEAEIPEEDEQVGDLALSVTVHALQDRALGTEDPIQGDEEIGLVRLQVQSSVETIAPDTLETEEDDQIGLLRVGNITAWIEPGTIDYEADDQVLAPTLDLGSFTIEPGAIDYEESDQIGLVQCAFGQTISPGAIEEETDQIGAVQMLRRNAYRLYRGDGVTTTFVVPFPFIDTSDLRVYVDGVLLAETDDWTYDGVDSVVLAVAPALGVSVVLLRVTAHAIRRAVIQGGTAVRSQDVLLLVQQVIYLAEELEDQIIGYDLDP